MSDKICYPLAVFCGDFADTSFLLFAWSYGHHIAVRVDIQYDACFLPFKAGRFTCPLLPGWKQVVKPVR